MGQVPGPYLKYYREDHLTCQDFDSSIAGSAGLVKPQLPSCCVSGDGWLLLKPLYSGNAAASESSAAVIKAHTHSRRPPPRSHLMNIDRSSGAHSRLNARCDYGVDAFGVMNPSSLKSGALSGKSTEDTQRRCLIAPNSGSG